MCQATAAQTRRSGDCTCGSLIDPANEIGEVCTLEATEDPEGVAGSERCLSFSGFSFGCDELGAFVSDCTVSEGAGTTNGPMLDA